MLDIETAPITTGTYGHFLEVANRASRAASTEQRGMIRALAAQHLPIEQATVEIEKIMGWST